MVRLTLFRHTSIRHHQIMYPYGTGYIPDDAAGASRLGGTSVDFPVGILMEISTIFLIVFNMQKFHPLFAVYCMFIVLVYLLSFTFSR